MPPVDASKPAESPEQGPLVVRRIEAESITLRSPGSKYSVAISAYADGAGIWLLGPEGDGKNSIGLNVGFHQSDPCLIIWGKDEQSGALPFAICPDHLQLRSESGSEPMLVSFADLLKAVEHVQNKTAPPASAP